MTDVFDVVVIGAGPAGLAAALALGRSRRRVVVLDRGARRNARAEHMHNFVTRDGITPQEFRRIGREQLEQYTTVVYREAGVRSITPKETCFEVNSDGDVLLAKRILLCTGLIDEPLPIPGFSELWGRSIFQCPYCHGWENRDLGWGYLMQSLETLDFVLKLRTWTSRVTVFTHGGCELPTEAAQRLAQRGIGVETRAIARFRANPSDATRLLGMELADGSMVDCDVLFAHPKQRQVTLVGELGLGLDEHGFVVVDPMTRRTSIPGVYAAGDLTTRMQGAIFAAAAGTQAAVVINHDLATT